MAITFNKLKNPKLQLTDVLTFGKFQQCRVCDILEQDYEYVLWLHDKNPQLFSPEVITEARHFKQEVITRQHFEEEVKPYTSSNPWHADLFWEDDLPF